MSGALEILQAPIEQILVSGGDARIIVDNQTGLNNFGCSPLPRPHVHSFGSSTASSISTQAYHRLEVEGDRLISCHPFSKQLDVQFGNIRHELLNVLDLKGSGTEIVFSPSGTDSVLQALSLVKGIAVGKPLDCIMLASDETGSGVPNALSGQHFSTITSKGVLVSKGNPIAGLEEGVTVIPVALRTQHGTPISLEDIDQVILDTVTSSVRKGHHVLLQAMDSSKLGARCPSVKCLEEIKSRFGDEVNVVVDACQMRLSRSRLRWHLNQGHIVLISGSKFFAGPPFSGALLVPKVMSGIISKIENFPTGLSDYSNACDWPVSWTNIRSHLPTNENYGQYFRWAAALHEMKTYYAIPLEFRTVALKKFEEMVNQQIEVRFPHIFLIPELDQPIDEIDDEEMCNRTIFPILIRQQKYFISFTDATSIYKALNQNNISTLPHALSHEERMLAAEICHLGQPVNVSADGENDFGALRICASAGMVSNIWARNSDSRSLNIDHEKKEIAAVLDKIELIARHLPAVYMKAA